METIELPIREQKNVNSYMQYALPLCILMTDKNFHPWILENFIQIKSFPKVTLAGNSLKYKLDNWPKNDLTKVDYYLTLNISKQDWSEVNNPISFLKEKISNNLYAYCQLNNYYIYDMAAYKKKTHIHFSLVYGYCLREEVFFAIAFNRQRELGKIKIYFKELYDASSIIRCVSKVDEKSLHVYTIGKNTLDQPYDFKIPVFKKIISEFLIPPPSDEWAYGVNAYSVIFDNLKSSQKGGQYIKYNVSHMLAEHKKMFMMALKYIVDRNNIEGRIYKLLNDYSDVSDMFNDIRLSYLSYAVDKKTFPNITCQTQIDCLHQKLKSAVEAEKLILTSILQCLP